MHKFFCKVRGKLSIPIALIAMLFLTGALGGISYVLASSTSNFTQIITAGTLTADIVDNNWDSVASPSVTFPSKFFSFACQASTAEFGSWSQRIYVRNPGAVAGAWSLTMAAPLSTSVWTSAGTPFDFNDPTGSGCTDGADADAVGGQMSVDPSVGTLAVGACAGCALTDVSKGDSSAFSEGVTNTMTLISALATADEVGDWYLTGVSIMQSIPAEQAVAADYAIMMTITAAAS
jgi:hypothetical protein